MGEAKRRRQTGQTTPQNKSRKPLIIGVTVLVVALVVALVAFLTAPPAPTSAELPVAAPDAEPYPVELDSYGVSVGDKDAPVVVREFADYQCPACAGFSDAARRLKQEYVESGQVRFVFYDMPLRQHANAMPAAQAARCADDQNAYWAMHDQLFDYQTEWSGSGSPLAVFDRYASELGLDERRFRNCMITELHRETVENSLMVAKQLKITSTPTVLVDNIRLTSPGWGQMSAVVERELNSSEQ